MKVKLSLMVPFFELVCVLLPLGIMNDPACFGTVLKVGLNAQLLILTSSGF